MAERALNEEPKVSVLHGLGVGTGTGWASVSYLTSIKRMGQIVLLSSNIP
jgi:hypothetical protein